jgi:hypothetical protein
MNKFEQLIEYVINDDEAKARELFHDIVVEKSRAIYEEMMAADEELEEAADEELEEDEVEMEEGMDPNMEGMGGDMAEDLIDDIETEESGVSMEDDHDMDDQPMMDGDQDEAELEDRVVDLEDKLDELMAEFESLMGDNDADSMDSDMDMEVGDDMDSEEMVDDELETEGMFEAVDLKAAPKPVTSEEGGVNKKSTVAANSGARGAVARPVSMTGDTAQGRTAPTVKDMGMTTSPKQSPAPKPHLGQAAGVNVKSVIQ